MLYNLLWAALLPIALPVFALLSIFRPDVRTGLSQRLGRLGGGWSKRTRRQPRVWIHAASAGEVLASLPLIRRMRDEHPEWDLVVSAMTPAGLRLAGERCPEGTRVFLFPLDLPGIPGRVLSRLEPEVVLLAETEIWPNFLRAARRRGIPVALFNGRISKGSERGYRAAAWIFRSSLRTIRLFGMQNEDEADRIIGLGAPPERVFVLGNLKFEEGAPSWTESDRRDFQSLLGWEADDDVLVAGSTHEGEEALVLTAWEAARKERPGLRLILAPRHLNRTAAVIRELQDRGLIYLRYSEIKADHKSPPDVLLVDVMGRLADLYDLGTAAFVGGSLVPVGGHNVLEPAARSCPVLFGPYTDQVSESVDLLRAAGGAWMVKDPGELAARFLNLAVDTRGRREAGEQARRAVEARRGASLKALGMVRELMEDRTIGRIRRVDRRSRLERWFKRRLLPDGGGMLTSLAAAGLRPLSFAYSGLQRLRVWAYRRGLLSSVEMNAPVISVGNLTLGGTGKTPCVVALAELFRRQGLRPAILTRGFGRRENCGMEILPPGSGPKGNPETMGDEPCLLAERLPEVPVLVSADRTAAGRRAVEAFGSDVLILDDGFQHLRIRRRVDLLILDARRPFGNGAVFPRGDLREAADQLRRADGILLTHAGEPSRTASLRRRLGRLHPGAPIFTGRHRPIALIHLPTGRSAPPETLRRNRVLAAAGIGEPEGFFRLLHGLGAELAAGFVFPDHYHFRAEEVETVEAQARDAGAAKVLTTEKDAVRLRAIGRNLEAWWAVRIALAIDEPAAFESWLTERLQ